MRQGRVRKLLKFGGLGIAITALSLYALQDSIELYLTPSELQAKANTLKFNAHKFRLGGLVEDIAKNGTDIKFKITDKKSTIDVSYHGLLPSLFAEHKGAIVYGKMVKNIFIADIVLAKHDENYKPRTSV